jgi:hypothetical protein
MKVRTGSLRPHLPPRETSLRRAAWLRAVPAGLALALAFGACSTMQPSAPPGSTPTDFGTPPMDDTSPGPSDIANSVTIDPELLKALPATVAGLPVEESPEGDQGAQEEPVLAKIATGAVGAVVVDTGSSDLANAFVVKLKPGALTDSGFRDWRDTYDEGVCGSSSAIVGHAETTIAGRTVFIGTCSAGSHTYHVWIKDKNLLITVFSLGARHLGELLLAELHP